MSVMRLRACSGNGGNRYLGKGRRGGGKRVAGEVEVVGQRGRGGAGEVAEDA